MSLKKLLVTVAMVPTLAICGCISDDSTNDEKVVYTEASKQETIAFLNQAVENDILDINGYSFKVAMSVPTGMFTSEEEGWPDTSDSSQWSSMNINGVFIKDEETFNAKYSMSGMGENLDFYFKDNVAYMNNGTNKYKATFDSISEIEEYNLLENLPTL